MTPIPCKIDTFQRLFGFTGWEGENEPELTGNLRANLPYFSFFADQEPPRFGGSSS